MNALFTQLLKPFAPMAQEHIEPDEMMDKAPTQDPFDITGNPHTWGDDIAPHIAKIPLRAEHRALLQAADAYEANAARLLELAWQAREQAQNLQKAANL